MRRRWYDGPKGVMMVERHSAPLADEQASELAITEVTSALQTVLGQRLTALIGGVRDPKLVAEWVRGARTPPAETQARLRSAWDVTRLLLQADAPDTIRAWFIGMDPFLDDQPPAVVMASDPDRVLRAAHSFLATG